VHRAAAAALDVGEIKVRKWGPFLHGSTRLVAVVTLVAGVSPESSPAVSFRRSKERCSASPVPVSPTRGPRLSAQARAGSVRGPRCATGQAQ
jgi:hypothetical protein